MKLKKAKDGNIEIRLSGKELGWFRQSLNECCNGFGVKNFKATIGVDENVPLHLLDQLRPMFKAPVGYEG